MTTYDFESGTAGTATSTNTLASGVSAGTGNTMTVATDQEYAGSRSLKIVAGTTAVSVLDYRATGNASQGSGTGFGTASDLSSGMTVFYYPSGGFDAAATGTGALTLIRQWYGGTTTTESTANGRLVAIDAASGLTSSGTLITQTSTPLAAGDKIVFTAVGAATNITVGPTYYVVTKTASTFGVATTLGGTALTLGTASGIAYQQTLRFNNNSGVAVLSIHGGMAALQGHWVGVRHQISCGAASTGGRVFFRLYDLGTLASPIYPDVNTYVADVSSPAVTGTGGSATGGIDLGGTGGTLNLVTRFRVGVGTIQSVASTSWWDWLDETPGSLQWVAGPATVVTGSGTASATVATTGDGSVDAPASGTVTTTASATGSGAVATSSGGDTSATAGITGAASVGKLATGTTTASATIAGAGSTGTSKGGTLTATATITGAGTTTAAASGNTTATATITGSGAVAVPVAVESVTTGSALTVAAGASLTFSHTVNSGVTLLVVAMQASASSGLSTVATCYFNGLAMTRQTNALSSAGTTARESAIFTLANPPVGTFSVQLPARNSGTTYTIVGTAISLTGASGLYGTAATAVSASTTSISDTTTSPASSLVITSASIRSTTPATGGAGTSRLNTVYGTNNAFAVNTATGATSLANTYSWTTADNAAIVSLPVTAVDANTPTGGGNVTPTAGITGAGAVTAAGTGSGTTMATASITGSGAVGASSGGTRAVTTTLAGSGTAAAASTGAPVFAAALTGAGVVTIPAGGSYIVTAAITGAGSVTVGTGGTGTRPETVTVTGTGAVTANGAGSRTASATITGAAQVATTSSGQAPTVVTIGGSGLVSTSSSGGSVTTVVIDGTGAVAETADGDLAVTAVITGGGTVTLTHFRDVTVTILGPYLGPDLRITGPYGDGVPIVGPYNYPLAILGPTE